MTINIKIQAVFMAVFLLLAPIAFAQLHFFPQNFNPHNLNYNGSVVVGITDQSHVLWREGEGLQAIKGRLPMPYMARVSVSNDGLKVGGTLKFGFASEMGVYNQSDANWALSQVTTDTNSQADYALAYRISGDGSTVVGVRYTNYSQTDACVFTEQGALQVLPYPQGNYKAARANVVNYDGNIVGGCVVNMSGQREGAYWQNGVFHLLKDDAGNAVGEPMAVTADGNILLGYDYGSQHKLYKYNISSQIYTVINPADTHTVVPILIDASDDGRVAIAVYYDYNNMLNSEVYIYVDKPEGEEDIYQNINTFLADNNIDMQGVNVCHLTALSGNGQVFTGVNGAHPIESDAYLVNMGDFLAMEEGVQVAKPIYRLFPNPAQDQLQVEGNIEAAYIDIYYVYGALIKRVKVLADQPVQNIDVSTLQSGVYYLEADSQLLGKFIKR